MPLPLQQEIIQALGSSSLSLISEIPFMAWEDYQVRYGASEKAIHCSTTRANIVHDHMVDHASKVAELIPGTSLMNLFKLRLSEGQ